MFLQRYKFFMAKNPLKYFVNYTARSRKYPFILKLVTLQKPEWNIRMKLNLISHLNSDKISCYTHTCTYTHKYTHRYTHTLCLHQMPACSWACSQDNSWGFSLVKVWLRLEGLLSSLHGYWQEAPIPCWLLTESLIF